MILQDTLLPNNNPLKLKQQTSEYHRYSLVLIYHHFSKVWFSFSFMISPILGVMACIVESCFVILSIVFKGSYQECLPNANLELCPAKYRFAFRSFMALYRSSGRRWMYLQSSLYCPFSKIARSILGNCLAISMKWVSYPLSPPM